MAAVELIVPGSLTTLTGGYVYDRRILEGLHALGHTTGIVSLDPSFPQPHAAALADARGALERIPTGRVVVIDGLALTGLTPLLARARERLRLVALIHHPLALETGLDAATAAALHAGERAALALVDRVIVTSRWTARALADFGVSADRVAVIEPGVDKPACLPRRISGTTLRLVSVGTLTPRKGHRVLIEALAQIADRQWTLRLAGSRDRDAATAAALEAQIAATGLGGRIELLGELPPAAIRREYAAADIFVLPSFLEGYGMVIAEAVAHGLPVVATAAGAVPDTLPAGAGILVPPGDAAALAAALAALCSDRAALAALAAGAARAAAALPTWQQAAAAFAAALADN